jgi:hypothetical protein
MHTVGQYTDPAMAFQPHYGMIQAQSSLAQEWGAYSGGAAAVARGTPPGVGAADFATALQGNFSKRLQGAGASALGGIATTAADFGGFALGAGIATKVAKMGLIGSSIVGLGVGAAVGAVAEKGIERGEKIFAETNQLGNIATAGRGFSTSQRHQFGRGFRDMASRMNISMNEMGDIASGIRGMGMMPRTRDVQQSLQQFESMAKDIRDIAVGMKTSLGNATRYLKSVEGMGLGRGSGGVFAAASMAEGLGTSLGGLISHVGMGQRVGRAAQVGGGTGGQLFLQSAFAGARGAGALTAGERLMSGGAMGLGRAFGMQAMQSALGPTGQMQLMAMMGPSGARALPGTMMGTLNQAAQNMFGGGSPIANMAEFTLNRRRMLNQLGGTGIRQMQAQAISTQGRMMQQMFPELGQQRALQLSAMNSGLNEHQSRAMASYIMRGFKDAGPSARVSGMPGVFGGGRAGIAAMRAGQETGNRAVAAVIAEESKMPYTRGIEWIGEKWDGMRRSLQVAASNHMRDRRAAAGYFSPSAEAMQQISGAVRRGTSIGTVDISQYGSSGAQLQSVLSFAGAKAGAGAGITTGSGTYGTGEIRSSMGRLARNIHKSSRLGSAAAAEQTQMELTIGKTIGQDRSKFKTVAQNIRANITKITRGGGDAAQAAKWLKSGIGKIFQGTKYNKEFKDLGFAGKHGPQMMNVLNRFMSPRGGEFSIQKVLQKQAATGMGAAAYALDVRGSKLISKLAGLGPVEPTEAEVATEAAETFVSATKLSPEALMSVAGAVSDGVPTEKKIFEQARARIIQRRLNDVKSDRAAINATRVITSKRFADYTKLRDTMFHKPYRDARAIVKRDPKYRKAKEGVRNAAVRRIGGELKKKATEANQKRLEAAEKHLMSDANFKDKGAAAKRILHAIKDGKQGEGLMKDIKQSVGLVNAKQQTKSTKRRARRPAGRVASFQTQSQSFQSQVAQALKRTGHTLSKIQGAMVAMEKRLGKK